MERNIDTPSTLRTEDDFQDITLNDSLIRQSAILNTNSGAPIPKVDNFVSKTDEKEDIDTSELDFLSIEDKESFEIRKVKTKHDASSPTIESKILDRYKGTFVK